MARTTESSCRQPPLSQNNAIVNNPGRRRPYSCHSIPTCHAAEEALLLSSRATDFWPGADRQTDGQTDDAAAAVLRSRCTSSCSPRPQPNTRARKDAESGRVKANEIKHGGIARCGRKPYAPVWGAVCKIIHKFILYL